MLSATMIGRTTMGRDEMASWQFAQLSLPDLLGSLRHVDAVIGPYYLLLHAWASVSDSAAWLRVPSTLAVAAAVAIAGRVGQRAWGPWAGILTGTALALHPVVATEAVLARPYALVLLLCTIGTAMVLAPGEPSRVRYAAVMLLAAAFHLFALAVVVAHLAIVRRLTFLLTASFIAVVSLPIALVAHAQRLQLAYVPMPTASSATEMARQVAVPGNYFWIAVVAIVVLGAAAVLGSDPRPVRETVVAALSLVLVPVVLLYLASHLLSPVLNPRYLITAPLGIALIIGAVAGQVRRPAWLPALLVPAVVLAAATGVRAVHHPRIKGADFPRLARVLADRARPGDGLQVAIRHSQGGTSAGVAYYTGDEDFLSDVLEGLPSGEPLRYERTITGPGSSVAEPGTRSTTWLVAVANTQPAFQAAAGLRTAGCRVAAPVILGELALYLARCPR